MPAYLIGTIHITDEAAWRRYVERVGATFAPYGGKVIFRAPKRAELARGAHGELVVVAEFPDLVALRAWHDSPQYQALVALREAGAEVALTAYGD